MLLVHNRLHARADVLFILQVGSPGMLAAPLLATDSVPGAWTLHLDDGMTRSWQQAETLLLQLPLLEAGGVLDLTLSGERLEEVNNFVIWPFWRVSHCLRSTGGGLVNMAEAGVCAPPDISRALRSILCSCAATCCTALRPGLR